jgi:hypothetical protein
MDESFIIHDEPNNASKPRIDDSLLLEQEFDRLLGPPVKQSSAVGGKPVQQPANPLPLPDPSTISMVDTSPVGQAATKAMIAMKTAMGSAADLLSKQGSAAHLNSDFILTESIGKWTYWNRYKRFKLSHHLIENPFLNAEVIESLGASQDNLQATYDQSSHNRLEMPTEFMQSTLDPPQRTQSASLDNTFRSMEKDAVIEDLSYDRAQLGGEEPDLQIEVPCEFDTSYHKRDDEESTISAHPIHRKIANIPQSPGFFNGYYLIT